MTNTIHTEFTTNAATAAKQVYDLALGFADYEKALSAATRSSGSVDEKMNKIAGSAKNMSTYIKQLKTSVDATTEAVKSQEKAMTNIDYNTEAKNITNMATAEKLLGLSYADVAQEQRDANSVMSQAIAVHKNKVRIDEDQRASNKALIEASKEYIQTTAAVEAKLVQLNAATGNLNQGSLGFQANMRKQALTTSDYGMVIARLVEAKKKLTAEVAAGNATDANYAQNQLRLLTIGAQITAMYKEQAAAAKASATAGAGAGVAGQASGLASRFAGTASKDTVGLLANLRRMGAISPQVSQLSYVLSLLTSSSALAALGIVAIGTATVALTVASVKAAAELQKYDITLQALATHGWNAADKSVAASQNLGKAVAAGMIEYAAESMYAFDKIAAGTEKLVGYGIDMRLVNGEMEMLGNLALGDSKRLENLAVAYGQVFGQGKARAQEMYQFINAGIPIFDALATKMGKTTGDIMDMTRKGEVSFTMIRDLLKDMTSEGGRYHDLMKQIAGLSFEGQITVFGNQLKIMLANLGSTLLPALTSLLVQINAAMNRGRQKETLKDIKEAYTNSAYNTDYGKEHAFDTIATAAIDRTVNQDRMGRERIARFGDTPYYKSFADYADYGAPLKGKQADVLNQLASVGQMSSGFTGDARRGKVTAFSKELAGMGLAAEDIRTMIIEIFYKNIPDKVLKGKSLEGIVSGVSMTNTYDNDPAALKKAIANSSFSTYADLSVDEGRSWLQDPDLIARLEKVLKLRKEIEMPAGGADADGADTKKRDFELDKLIEKLEEEKQKLLELVPIWKLYQEAENAKAKDIAPKEMGSGKSMEIVAGMPEDDATRKAALVKQLYNENTALKAVEDAYKSIYTYQTKYQELQEEGVVIAMSAVKAQLVQRGMVYEFADALTTMVSSLAEANLSIDDMTSFAGELNDAFDRSAKGPDSHIGIMASQLVNLQEIMKDFPNISLEMAKSFAIFAGAVGDDRIKESANRLKKLNSAMTGRESVGNEFLDMAMAQSSRTTAPKVMQALQDDYSARVMKDLGISESDADGGFLGGIFGIDEKQQDLVDAKGRIDAKKLTQGDSPSDMQIAETDGMTAALEKQAEAFRKNAAAARVMSDAVKSIGMGILTTTLDQAGESMYSFGRIVAGEGDNLDSFEEQMKTFGRSVMNQLPGLLMSAAIGVMTTTGGTGWPLALALAGASLGTSFLGGIMGSQEQLSDSNDDDQLALLQNLQEQFALMIAQFEQNMLYLDVMRTRYISDSQLALTSAYADGDTFAGGTGLKHGVYSQPTFFKFANGGQFSGVLGEAGPEAVLPLERGPDGKLGVAGGTTAAPVSISINNYSNAAVTDVKESTNASGAREIAITIEAIVSGMVASGKLDGPMQRYGAQPQAVRRS